MDKGDRNMDQFLTDLHIMKDQLRRDRGAASPQTGDMEDIQLKVDVLMARLLSCTPQTPQLPSTSFIALRGEPPTLQETASSPST